MTRADVFRKVSKYTGGKDILWKIFDERDFLIDDLQVKVVESLDIFNVDDNLVAGWEGSTIIAKRYIMERGGIIEAADWIMKIEKNTIYFWQGK